MTVDAETGVYIGYGIIVLVAIGIFAYAKLFLIDRSGDKNGKRGR